MRLADLILNRLQISPWKNSSWCFHDSLERCDPPECHPNTRVAVLAEIMQWVRDTEDLEDGFMDPLELENQLLLKQSQKDTVPWAFPSQLFLL